MTPAGVHGRATPWCADKWDVVPAPGSSPFIREYPLEPNTSQAFFGPLKSDAISMAHLRKTAVQMDHLVFRRNDDIIVETLASRVAAHQLLLKRRSTPAFERPMTGYFTLLKYVMRAQRFVYLEDLLGYRRGRLSTKGVLIYRFLRLPEITEFEVRGSSITPEDRWNEVDAPKRAAALAAAAPYHRVTKVPSFDEIQKRNARSLMALSGDDTVIKLYPIDWQPVDDTPAGYKSGLGIPQWRLTDDVSRRGSLLGRLLFRIGPGCGLPWVR